MLHFWCLLTIFTQSSRPGSACGAGLPLPAGVQLSETTAWYQNRDLCNRSIDEIAAGAAEHLLLLLFLLLLRGQASVLVLGALIHQAARCNQEAQTAVKYLNGELTQALSHHELARANTALQAMKNSGSGAHLVAIEQVLCL